MSRPATGSVVVDSRRKSPTFSLRFRAYGRRQYVTLGSAADGWTQDRANAELQNVLADVRRGIWRPPLPESAPATPVDDDPIFHVFASEWFAANEGAWRPKTRVDYHWQLTNHLLPFFANHHLSQITIQEVDRYRSEKVRGGVLGTTSINKTITRLGQILEVAVEYQMLERNPAKGKNRRLKPSKPPAIWLDSAAHIRALIDAAGELDARAREDRQHVSRKAMLATLTFAGLRLGELLDLRWRDVDLHGSRITVRESKTGAGVRTVDMLPVLRDELLALKARGDRQANELVFPTTEGRQHGQSNIRRRVLAPAVKLANERLAEAGEVPLPEHLSPHKLRHTYASLLVAVGVDPGSTMDQLGHTDAVFTLRVYRHAMRRDDASKLALRKLVGADLGSGLGSSGGPDAPAQLLADSLGQQKIPR